MTVADNVLDLLTLIFFATHPSKKYRQENISVGRLTGKLYFCVNLSLMGYACRVPDRINFFDGFSRFLDGFLAHRKNDVSSSGCFPDDVSLSRTSPQELHACVYKVTYMYAYM